MTSRRPGTATSSWEAISYPKSQQQHRKQPSSGNTFVDQHQHHHQTTTTTTTTLEQNNQAIYRIGVNQLQFKYNDEIRHKDIMKQFEELKKMIQVSNSDVRKENQQLQRQIQHLEKQKFQQLEVHGYEELKEAMEASNTELRKENQQLKRRMQHLEKQVEHLEDTGKKHHLDCGDVAAEMENEGEDCTNAKDLRQQKEAGITTAEDLQGCDLSNPDTWPEQTPHWARAKQLKTQLKNVEELVKEYLVGLPGPPSLKLLEEKYGTHNNPHIKKGTGWRSSADASEANKKCRHWCERKRAYDIIDKEPNSESAIAKLEGLIQDKLPHKIPEGKTVKECGWDAVKSLLNHLQTQKEGHEARSEKARKSHDTRKKNKKQKATNDNTVM